MPVVYRAQPGNDLAVAMDRLGDRGLHPVAIDSASPVLRHFAGAMIRVRIAVPEDEADAAREEIERWEAETAVTARDHAKEFRRDLGLAILVAAVVGGVLWTSFPARPAMAATWAGIVGFLTLLLGGRIRLLLSRRRDDT